MNPGALRAVAVALLVQPDLLLHPQHRTLRAARLAAPLYALTGLRLGRPQPLPFLLVGVFDRFEVAEVRVFARGLAGLLVALPRLLPFLLLSVWSLRSRGSGLHGSTGRWSWSLGASSCFCLAFYVLSDSCYLCATCACFSWLLSTCCDGSWTCRASSFGRSPAGRVSRLPAISTRGAC